MLSTMILLPFLIAAITEVRDTTQNCVVENGFSLDVTGLYVVVGTMYRLDHPPPFTTPMYNHAARFRLK